MRRTCTSTPVILARTTSSLGSGPVEFALHLSVLLRCGALGRPCMTLLSCVLCEAPTAVLGLLLLKNIAAAAAAHVALSILVTQHLALVERDEVERAVLWERAPVGILGVDARGRVEGAPNAAARALLRRLAEGEPLADLFEAPSRGAVEALLARALDLEGSQRAPAGSALSVEARLAGPPPPAADAEEEEDGASAVGAEQGSRSLRRRRPPAREPAACGSGADPAGRGRGATRGREGPWVRLCVTGVPAVARGGAARSGAGGGGVAVAAAAIATLEDATARREADEAVGRARALSERTARRNADDVLLHECAAAASASASAPAPASGSASASASPPPRTRRTLNLRGRRRRFALIALHELRQPLGIIAGLVDELWDALHPSTTAPDTAAGAGAASASAEPAIDAAGADEVLATLRRTVRSLSLITDDIVDFSRLEVGADMGGGLRYGCEEPTSRTRVRALLEWVYDAFAGAAGGVDLAVRAEPACPPVALLDRQGMRHALSNLVHNALRFTPQGGRVALAARALRRPAGEGDAGQEEEGEEGGGDLLEFVVEDTGVGIAEGEIEAVFEPFHQASTPYPPPPPLPLRPPQRSRAQPSPAAARPPAFPPARPMARDVKHLEMLRPLDLGPP
eukprot:tig00020816_g14190.t1